MIVINKTPVTLAEVKARATNLDEKKPLFEYLKKFVNLDKAKADKLIQELRDLNNIKIREENLVKIADILPQNAEDVNKIFNEVGLSEDEVSAILNIVKNY